MALKPDMVINRSDPINVTDAVAEAGYLAVIKTQPSGRAVGAGYNDAAKLVGTAASPASGARVAGVFIGDVVNIDQTKQHRNFQKNFEAVVGEPVELLTDGWVVTNAITGTPTPGAPAYIGADSKFVLTQVNSIPAVGWFETVKDADGYAKVQIRL